MSRIRSALQRVADRIIRIGERRPPDISIGGKDNPYLRRWYLVPRNRVLNVYLHQFLRDDDDRALHDHPWLWISIILRGRYVEQTIAAGGIHRRRLRRALSVRFGTPWTAHRVDLVKSGSPDAPALVRAWARNNLLPDYAIPCWTLFITGPRVRNWGFHCPRGWVPWQRFTDPADPSRIGPGCDDQPTALQQALRRIDQADNDNARADTAKGGA